jgi:hypothetical protein
LSAGGGTDAQSELYQVVYEESQHTLEDQRDELNSLRDRAVQFSIFIGARHSFPHRLRSSEYAQDNGFFALAGAASAISLAAVGLLFVTLRPPKKKLWYFRLSSKYLIDNWIESEVPRPTKVQFIRALALMNDDSRDRNEKLLAPLRHRYRILAAAGTLQVVLWAALVWWKG